MFKPELLSPAGTLKNMRYAFAYGADAVYAGQPRYSLRVRNNEFNHENLQLGINEAHALGKKFYVVVNIAPHNAKLKTFIRDLKPVVEMGPDALIMSDPGLIMLVREHFPEMPIHLSVQANAVNWATVKFWQQMGLTRVILSRELSLDEIEEIRRQVPEMEIEIFVHGALCMAYSGRFTVDVIGTSSHAATPHLGADAITGAAAIINNLQQYVSRMSNPLDPVVLTIGTISGGNRYNAIANYVTMEGVTRAYFLDKHEEAMRQIVENTAEGLGMKAVLKYAHVVHPVINDDDDLTEIAQKAVVKLFDEETLCHMPAMMGSEDFANYAAEIPAVFGFIGCRDEANGMTYNNHHEKFTVNESLLPKGTALMAQFAVDYLAGNA